MKILSKNYLYATLLALAFLVSPVIAFAQGTPAPGRVPPTQEAAVSSPEDEIQVYDAAIAEKGKFNLTWHNNFTPRGSKVPAFPGGLITDKTLNGVPEWAYGVTTWFEAGLYMPLYSITKDNGPKLNGFKLRTLFVSPNADDRTFVYGVNFEFSWNARHWDDRRFTSEIRPIVGWHLKPIDIIINPIVDTSYYGGVKNLEFVPAERVTYNLHHWAVGLEEYGDYGKLREFVPANEQSHVLYWVVDKDAKKLNIEAGIGFGLTQASDKLVLKLILSRDLN
jgi:hypothetical protein